MAGETFQENAALQIFAIYFFQSMGKFAEICEPEKSKNYRRYSDLSEFRQRGWVVASRVIQAG
jgi:hypothetical protein